MLYPVRWEETAALFDNDEEERFDRYDDKEQARAVAMLSPYELAVALRACAGCGCCVNGGALNLRSAVLAKVRGLLEDYPDDTL